MNDPRHGAGSDLRQLRDWVASYTAPRARRPVRSHRVFVDDEHVAWTVRECAAPADLCARGSHCLIFESDGRARRVWSYPQNWRDLDEPALTRLSLGT